VGDPTSQHVTGERGLVCPPFSTAHPIPANVAVDEQQLIALVHYCLSLGKTPKRSLTSHQRAVQAWRRDSHLSDSAGIGGISLPRPGSTDASRRAATVRAGERDAMRGVSSRRDDLGTPLFAEVIGSLDRGVARPHDIRCGPAASVSVLGLMLLVGFMSVRVSHCRFRAALGASVGGVEKHGLPPWFGG